MGTFAGIELDELRLEGPRLVLRRWDPADAERVAEVMRDPTMTDFLALPDPYTVDDARQFVTEFGHEGRAGGTGFGSAVVERGTGRVVGSAALRLDGDPEIGYWVARDARGHGYATEVCRTLADWAFAHGSFRVRIACASDNASSVATALAAGFAFEGVTRGGVLGGGRNGVPERRGQLARFARLAPDAGDPIAPMFPRLPAEGPTDGVLRLRVIEPGDAQAFNECDDDEAVRWNFTGHHEPLDVTRRAAERAPLEWLVGPAGRLAMIDVETGRFAGDISVRRVGPPQVGGVGYAVHPDFRGRGYTTRALRLLVPWAFGQAGLARLELGAKMGNVGSQRAAANAGFEPDGIRRGRLRNADGTFGDEMRYYLVNPDLAAPPA